MAAAPERAHGARAGVPAPEHFGRIFRLPPFAEQSPKVEAALRELGKPGGLLDAADPLSAGPKALIVDPSLSANNPNNPTHTAGTTFFGQFLDHDMTFDASSRLAQATDPETTRNFRTPALDLDSVYGAGPVAQQELYDPADHIKLKVESGGAVRGSPAPRGRRRDRRRPAQRRAPDHRRAALRLPALPQPRGRPRPRAGRLSDAMDVFAEARRLTTWHYQWLVVHEFLPQIVGQAMVDDVLRRGRRFYRPRRGEAFIPVEFQTGAYRMGHSMVRPSYRANLAGDDGQPFFGFIFDPVAGGQADPDDLRGGAARRAPVRRLADLLRLRRRRGQAEQEDRHEDLHAAVRPAARARSPATTRRRRCRSATCSATSRGSCPPARASPAPWASRRSPRADLEELAPLGVGFERSTPLWYYVLKEAEVVADGLHLGPVGGRIVAEVFLGLLQIRPGLLPRDAAALAARRCRRRTARSG